MLNFLKPKTQIGEYSAIHLIVAFILILAIAMIGDTVNFIYHHSNLKVEQEKFQIYNLNYKGSTLQVKISESNGKVISEIVDGN